MLTNQAPHPLQCKQIEVKYVFGRTPGRHGHPLAGGLADPARPTDRTDGSARPPPHATDLGGHGGGSKPIVHTSGTESKPKGFLRSEARRLATCVPSSQPPEGKTLHSVASHHLRGVLGDQLSFSHFQAERSYKVGVKGRGWPQRARIIAVDLLSDGQERGPLWSGSSASRTRNQK